MHFNQADTIVPNIGDPADYNRFSYVRYNPLRYTDVTGHNPECGPDGVYCDDDEWNDYEYDVVELSDGGKRIIRIARELERLIGRKVTLQFVIRLIFEREFNGYGALTSAQQEELGGVFEEATARSYWAWSGSRYR